MIRLSKKAIAAITGVSVVIITGSTILANLALKQEKQQDSKKVNPLDRGSNYHHYPISNKIATDTKLNNLIDKIEEEGSIIYLISEQKFVDNIKSYAINALKNTSAFAKTYLNYNFICNYKIKNTKSILVDLVWFENSSKIRYYDQFVLSLETI